MTIKYRPEIDGIRTIAVLSVILYHAELSMGGNKLLSGGFLGVDVFFVISGFLITSLMMNELQQTETISIPNFYKRRARRLLPALLAVMLVSLPFSWTLLLPEQLVDYAKSLLSSLLFGSNFYWNYSLQQYGAESSLLKPFLHTWSLAIEEQYYIVYPLILLGAYKWCRSKVTTLLTAGVLLSFIYAVWMTERDAAFSFYMLPSRFWELLTGGLLARNLHFNTPKNNDSTLNKWMPALGLGLIFYSIAFVELDSANHPGFSTLPSIVGTALIIWFANKSDPVTQLLSSKLFVGLGLLSYSLYLWHYPIFAFGRMLGSSDDIFTKFLWIALTFLASLVSYYLIEKPLRNTRIVNDTLFWMILASMLVVICSACACFILSNGNASRLNEVEAYSEFKQPEFDRLESSSGINVNSNKKPSKCFNRDPFDACHFGNGMFVTLGDSYAGQYDSVLQKKLSSLDLGLITLTYGLCPLVQQGMKFSHAGYLCPAINKKRWQVIAGFDAGKIFIVSSNVALFEAVKGEIWTLDDVWKDYKSSVEKLLSKGHKVILLTGAPGGDDAIVQRWKIEARKQAFNARSTPVFHPKANLYQTWQIMHSPQFELSHENLIQIRVADLFCLEETDRRCLVIGDTGSYYNRGTHLSSIGAKVVLDHMFSEMKQRGWID